MADNTKQQIVDDILMRAADDLGDITPLAMRHYYQQYPEARASFDQQGPGNVAQLEGIMIENCVYCLMRWFENPHEIDILLSGSVVHHSDTLNVPAEWYSGLIQATADVITSTIPQDNAEQLAVWKEAVSDLHQKIHDAGALTACKMNA